jgi:leader peptidase (prepilin peptidase) / N-methyltransferase
MQPASLLGLAALAVLGLLVGTVLDSVVARVPDGAPVLAAARPQCACGERRRGRDGLPLVWIGRPARACPACGARPGRRRWILEVATGATFLALGGALQLSWELPAYLYLAAVSLALGAIDLATRRLPNALTLPAYPIFGGLLLLPAIAEGLWASYARALLGGLSLFAIYLLLALLNPAGMGLGDVKLSGVLGAALAWFGWSVWVVGACAAFLLAAVVGGALLITRRAGRGSLIPFGPFMVAGTFFGILSVPLVAGLALAAGALG